ncbi:dNTP triphosphohydrolase [Alloprevotella sp. OH1205_COT-284]|uniref:dGTP triphosphohydrolase n=1 Tax=Alloprevotella sp. OH1205_COT-284 TaxID=2491043 RepID=UPI000F5FA084|nr:dNTP triphosphohydrolase [Alloprevotella sp. OH1205_COT-284]RRD79959.1 dNTP triphosphohydrolase [Alloprevotella sp. OH1205_COT-284]
MNWQDLISSRRLGKEDSLKAPTEQRTEFQRDYDRLIFSAPFRRMQNKTQVFPLPGSIFVHNRLTHSLEVSSVGRSLGADVARELLAKHAHLDPSLIDSISSIVSAACLAHDMGNPPFGHSGEAAIRSFFKEGRGQRFHDRLPSVVWEDITHFDGNANTFRLLTHQFNGRRKGGFVMTYTTLASVVKYPFASTLAGGKPKFGFFDSERETIQRIFDTLGVKRLSADGAPLRYARHPLVYLVEAADDICYQIMDIEDAHKLRLLSAEETISLYLGFFDDDECAEIRSAYPENTDVGDRIVYFRSCVINALERACVRVFADNEEAILSGTFEGTLIRRLPSRLAEAYRRCSEVAKRKIYSSKEVTDIELSGYHIIHTLLDLMTEAVEFPEKKYSELLMKQVSSRYELSAPDLSTRIMAVADYLSGMTDIYALDLYRKINGQQLPMI